MKLTVCLEGQVAGLIEASAARVRFVYADSWLTTPGAYPLSHSLSLQPAPIAGKAVINFLWGLLPDNPRTLDAWGRQFHVSARNPVALLAHVGEDCAGAVQFVSEDRLDEVLDAANKPARVEWLDTADLERRVRHLTQDAGATRETADEGQFSLSGVQAKTAFHFDAQRKRWGVPHGRTPTTHILKPVANGFDGFAENEHFCLALAHRIGLAAASSEWQLIGGIPTLVAERYDRVYSAGRWHRIHQEDCCQALGIHPSSKYENEGGPGIPEIMRLLNSCAEPEADRERFMTTACLTYLLGATDAHAKNCSLLHGRSASGARMRLAPLYDIASAWPYPRRIPLQKMKLAMCIGRHYKVRDIQPRHFSELAHMSQYPADRLLASLGDLAERLPDEAISLQKALAVKGMQRPILAALVDGIAERCRVVRQQLA